MRRNLPKGQALLLSIVLLAVVFGLSGAFVSYVKNVQTSTSVFSARSAARTAAQAGIDKSVWCLNQSAGTNCGGTYGTSFTGETSVAIGGAFYTTTITSVASNKKTVSAMGYYPNITKPVSVVTLKADITINTDTESFHYGVQSGYGGFTLGNNAHVTGNIYANGNVVGSNGAYVTGTVWVAGGTAVAADQSQLVKNNDFTFARTSPVIDMAQGFQLSGDNVLNKVSFYIKKVGAPANATVNILADNAGVPSKTVLVSGTLVASSVTTSYGWVDVSFATPPAILGGTTYWVSIDGSASSANYWIIGGDTGKSYAIAPGMTSASWNAGTPVWTDAGLDFDFKVWTGGVTTKIDTLHVTGDAHANTIANSTIDADAYYQTKTATTVGGTSHPGSADPGPQDMPISDAQIQEWKDDGANGGTTVGDVTYSGTSNSLGPKKITGNLTVTNNGVLTINGTLWVQGNVSFSNNAIIKLTPGYGANSGVIVVDGTVDISNNATFQNSGTAGSYIMVLTTSSSAAAMTLSNNSANSIFYASNGTITVANNATLKEVTAFKLSLSNNASVTYESGLANVNFTSGPGASWILSPGTVREIK